MCSIYKAIMSQSPGAQLFFAGFFPQELVLSKESSTRGHRRIYADLLKRFAKADVASLAAKLELSLNEAGEAEIVFCGGKYILSGSGVRRSDGQGFSYAAGSALIRYLLKGSPSRPAGRFIKFAELAGPVFRHGGYSSSALESPVVKRFQGRVIDLLETAEWLGGRRSVEAGLGSVSMIFDLLPHIPIQLIFYDRDEEFPARANWLFDCNATQLIDFESLAVLTTIFVQSLTRH